MPFFCPQNWKLPFWGVLGPKMGLILGAFFGAILEPFLSLFLAKFGQKGGLGPKIGSGGPIWPFWPFLAIFGQKGGSEAKFEPKGQKSQKNA